MTELVKKLSIKLNIYFVYLLSLEKNIQSVHFTGKNMRKKRNCNSLNIKVSSKKEKTIKTNDSLTKDIVMYRTEIFTPVNGTIILHTP